MTLRFAYQLNWGVALRITQQIAQELPVKRVALLPVSCKEQDVQKFLGAYSPPFQQKWCCTADVQVYGQAKPGRGTRGCPFLLQVIVLVAMQNEMPPEKEISNNK